jgi:hypothetical protein
VPNLLTHAAIEELEKLGYGMRHTASEIEQAVKDYGRTIVPLPEQWYEGEAMGHQ